MSADQQRIIPVKIIDITFQKYYTVYNIFLQEEIQQGTRLKAGQSPLL